MSENLIEMSAEWKQPEAQPIDNAEKPQLIEGFPRSTKQEMGDTAIDAAAMTEEAGLITSIPGVESSNAYRSPEDAVAEINKDLSERDPSLPQPAVRAGDNQAGSFTQ